MAQENKKLGDLYKDSFSDFEAPVNTYDWNDVEKRLDKMKFYRLSFTHFNIYYSLLILGCFIASLISTTHYFLVTVPRINAYTAATVNDPNSIKITDKNNIQDPGSIKKEENNEKSIKEESNKIVKRGNTTPKPSKEKSFNRDYAGAESPDGNKVVKNQSDKTQEKFGIPISDKSSNETIRKDSVALNLPLNKEKDSLKTQKLLKTPKKTVYITKQDTIFEYDTLKTKKNKRFRK